MDSDMGTLDRERAGGAYLDRCIALFGRNTPIGIARMCNALHVRELAGEAQPTVGDLAREMGVPKSTASRWATTLYEMGIVRFEEDPKDSRRKFLMHTERFLRMYEECCARGTCMTECQNFRRKNL